MEQIELNYIHWRLFQDHSLGLQKKNTLLYGANGSGKTTLLSGIYALYTGQVWPGSTWRQQIQTGQNYFGIKCDDIPDWYMSGLISSQGRVVTRWGNDIPHDWLYTIITYLPDENRWLSLSRSAKLAIFDQALTSLYGKEYQQAVLRLEKAVLQKGRLIKLWQEQGKVDTLLVQQYHDVIAKESAKIWRLRTEFVHAFGDALPHFGDWVETEIVTTRVRWHVSQGREKILLREDLQVPNWQSVWEKEKSVGRVFFGAQRDDVSIELNEQAAEQFLSRGETRAFLVFFKLFIRNHIQSKVLWLLDDFFNEFDSEREKTILKQLVREDDWIIAAATEKVKGFQEYIRL